MSSARQRTPIDTNTAPPPPARSPGAECPGAAAPAFRRRPLRNRPRRGATVTAILGAVAVLTAGTIGVLSLPLPYAPMVMAEPASNHELAVTLTRLGLTPEPLAAAGLGEQPTTVLVNQMREHLVTGMDLIRIAEEQVGDLSRTVDVLTRRIRDGQGTQKDIDQLRTATEALQTARGDRAELLTAAFSAAVDGLEPATIAALSTHRANDDGVAGVADLPTQYLFTGRTEAQWVELREALINTRVTARYGEEPDPALRDVILAANAEPATAAAATNLSVHLPAVTQAWNAAVYGR